MQVSESRVKFTGTMTSRSLSPNPYRGQFVICLTPLLVYILHNNTQYLYILNIFLHTFYILYAINNVPLHPISIKTYKVKKRYV